MSQTDPPASPLSLLFHDGELADMRQLLDDLGTPYVERRATLLPEDRNASFDLVLATPQRMLDLAIERNSRRPTLVAICDADSRSLRNSLRRAGIHLMVRRPVHPAVLRALVVHALYSGPEKRGSPRVNIGAPVRLKVGWRQRPAILADLSLGGCRLLASQPLEPDRSITLCVPPELAGGRGFSIKARVLRNFGRSSDGYVLSAAFKASARQQSHLQRAIAQHRKGPASYEHDGEPPGECPAEPAAAPQAKAAAAPQAKAAAAPQAEVPRVTLTAVQGGNGERRTEPRRSIDRRVIALNEEAARVLMGRDISLGGMRVNPSPLLVVGQNVKLAIHVRRQQTPLVVTARVHRDDGERGVVLRFHQLAPDSTRTLNQMLDTLPVLDPGCTHGDGMIVSEILAEAH